MSVSKIAFLIDAKGSVWNMPFLLNLIMPFLVKLKMTVCWYLQIGEP